MSNIIIGKTDTSLESLHNLFDKFNFKFELIDTDDDIEFVETEFGFTWVRACDNLVTFPESDGSCHYWANLEEAYRNSIELNFESSQIAEDEIAYRQEVMG